MGCPCYWGCATAGNKIVWGLMATLAIVGIALAIGGGVGGRSCFKDYQTCVDKGGDNQACYDRYNARCSLGRYWGLLFTGILLIIVVVPLLTSYFCCCSRKPNREMKYSQGVVQAAVPLGTPPPPHAAYGSYGQQQPYPQGHAVAYVSPAGGAQQPGAYPAVPAAHKPSAYA